MDICALLDRLDRIEPPAVCIAEVVYRYYE
jgi:hypothetical protein